MGFRGPGTASMVRVLSGQTFYFLRGRKSVILGVWVSPGAPETSPLGGPTFWKAFRAPRGRPHPQNDRFPTPLKFI